MKNLDELVTKYGFKKTKRTPYKPFDYDIIDVYTFGEEFKAELCFAFRSYYFNGNQITLEEFINKIENKFDGKELRSYPSYSEAIKSYHKDREELEKRWYNI